MYKRKKISVIITTYNRPNNVIEILKLLNKQLNIPIDIEILICDSSSNGNLRLLNFIKSYSYLDIKYLNLKKNHQAFKRNKGAKYSQGNYLIFLDDDCFPEKYFYLIIIKNLNYKKKDIFIVERLNIHKIIKLKI